MVRLPTNTKRIAVLVCVLFGALLLRTVNLDADPSSLISRDFITDEGWWAHNARNLLLFGQWRIDDQNTALFSAPLYNVLLTLSYKAFGISFMSMRLVSAFAGALTVVLGFLLVRREVSWRAALFAAALLGFSNLHIIYSRTGFVESTIVFFLTLATLLWSLRSYHRIFALLSGAVFALMLITKITAIYLIPGLLLVIAASWIRRSVDRQEAALFLTGLSLVGAIYFFLFLISNFDVWVQTNLANGAGVEWSSDLAGEVYSKLKVLGSSFYAKAPLVTALTLLSIGQFVVSASRKGLTSAIRDAREIETIGGALLIGYLFSLSFTIYQPERRFLPALLLMVLLSAALLERGWTTLRSLSQPDQMGPIGWFSVLFLLPTIGILHLRVRLDPAPLVWLLKGIIIVALIAIAVAVSRGRLSSRFIKRLLLGSRALFVLLFLVLSFGSIYKTLELWGVDLAHPSKYRSLVIASLGVLLLCGLALAMFVRDAHRSGPYLVCAFMLIELTQISTWLFLPTYTLREASASMEKILTRDDTIVTHYETALMTTAAKVICRSERRGLNVDVFETSQPQYVMVLSRDNWRDNALEELPVGQWPSLSRFVVTRMASFDLCPTLLRGPRFIVELHSLTPREKRQKKNRVVPE